MRKPKSKKGFTLIELVISMAIIAVLLLLATGRYRHHVEKANDIHIIADTNSLQKELKTELLHENTEFKGDPVDKNTLVGKKIYSARKIEEELPQEELYEVKNPEEHINTVLTGKFIASANADTYYVDNSTKSNKPNPNPNPFDNIDYDDSNNYGDKYDVIERDTGTITPPELQPPVCSEELNKLNGNYKITLGSDFSTYLQESTGSMIKIDSRCFKIDTFINDIVKLKGVNGTIQLSRVKDPIVQVIKQEGNILTLKDKDDNTGKVDISSAEIFTEDQSLQDKKIQVKLIPNTTKAEIINILEYDSSLQDTIQDLMIDAPLVKENMTRPANISTDDIFRSSETNSITLHLEGKATINNATVIVYTDDSDLLEKLEDYLKENGEAKIQAKYEQNNKDTYKKLIQLEVLTDDGYKDIKTI